MSRENARSRRGNPYLNSASRESVRPSSSSSTLFHSANDTSATRKKGQFGGVEESMHQRTGAKRNNSTTTSSAHNACRFSVARSRRSKGITGRRSEVDPGSRISDGSRKCALLREEGRVLYGYNRVQPECSHSFHQRAESPDIRYMQDI